jgi:hypothetical protein
MTLGLLFSIALAASSQTGPIQLSAPEGAWPALETWLSEQAGIPCDAASIPRLQSEIAELLRNEPSLSLQSALPRAFIRVRGLPSAKAAILERSLGTRTVLRNVDDDKFAPVYVRDGRLFADRSSGWVRRVGEFWRQVPDDEAKELLDFARQDSGGREPAPLYLLEAREAGDYVSTGGRLYRLEGDQALPVAANASPLSSRDPGKHVLIQPGRVTFPSPHEGHAVWELHNGVWRFAFPPPAGWKEAAAAAAASAPSTSPSDNRNVPRLEQRPDGSISERGRTIFQALDSLLGFGR